MQTHFDFKLDKKRIHLGVCGSISAYRSPDILRNLQKAGATCSVCLTPAATKFISPLTFASLGASPVYTAMFDDMSAPSPFAHLEPGQIADCCVIAPASASTLARIAGGMADELLACQVLAFTGAVVLAPAMNPHMWENKSTQHNIKLLQDRGMHIVPPGIGHTACGDIGQGRLAELDDIHLAVLKALSPQDMAGQKVMLTLGPTREHIDVLRYVTNPSTGTMGACLAVAAWLRGAEVTALCGPGCPPLPKAIKRIDIISAQDLYVQAKDLWPAMDIGVFTAAVADFRPQLLDKAHKFKKAQTPDGFDLHFVPNPDILSELGNMRKKDQKVIGFAAESQALEESAAKKLVAKNAHMIVGNLLKDGFGTASNSVYIIDAQGRKENLPDLPKAELAMRIFSWLLCL